MSELSDAIADGIAAVSAAQGSSWAFGSVTFDAAESDLKPNDPRMVGAPDRLIELRINSALLPSSGYPKRGNEITRGGETYKVHRHDHHFASGVFILLVHRSSAAAFGTTPAGPDFNGDFNADFKTS